MYQHTINKHLNSLISLCDSNKQNKVRLDSHVKYIIDTPYSEYFKSPMYFQINGKSCIIAFDKNSITNKRFMVSILTIVKNGQHANALIIDNEEKTLERFEPHGWNTDPNYTYVWEEMEKECTLLAEKRGLIYTPSKLYHTKCGPQAYDGIYFKTKNFGLCIIWSLVYIILRISEPEIPLIDLYQCLNQWSIKQNTENNIMKISQSLLMFKRNCRYKWNSNNCTNIPLI
jgi:hypothetical protein